MKKAKIILAAMCIFAVVGGALAFKAQRNLTPVFTPTGISTYTSGTFSRTVPVCTTTFPFLTNDGILSTVFKSTVSGIITQTTPGGPVVTVTFPGCTTVLDIVTLLL